MATSSQPDLLRAASTMLLLLRMIEQRLRDDLDQPLGLPELSVLQVIDRGVTLPSGLSRVLHLDPGRVSRIVDQLAEGGLVCRGRDLGDRRLCPLSLTEAGRTRLVEGKRAAANAMATILEGLPKSQMRQFATSMSAVRAVLDGGGTARMA